METKQYRNTIKWGAYFVSDVSIHSFHVFFLILWHLICKANLRFIITYFFKQFYSVFSLFQVPTFK